MRILHVIPAFLPSRHYGGGPGVVAALADEQARKGHEVHVLTTDALDADARVRERTAVVGGARVHYVRNLSNALAYRHKLFLSPGLLRPLGGGLRGVDVVHLHDYRTYQNAVVARAARKAGVPYVLQAHGALQAASGKTAVKRVLDAAAGRRLVRGAARCLALNDTEAAEYVSLGASPGAVVQLPNGIDAAVAARAPGEAGAFRRALGVGPDAFLVLYAGRLHPSKSVDLLLRAFADLGPEGATLALVGPDDGDEERLRRLARERGIEARTRFVGFVDEETKWSAYRDADAVVVPSFFGFPLVFCEAWSAGAPIVTTPLHHRLAFFDGRAGLVASPDAAGIARALQNLRAKPSERRRMGEEARRMVLEGLTWPAIAARALDVYEEARACSVS